jgi:hypothetical protein
MASVPEATTHCSGPAVVTVDLAGKVGVKHVSADEFDQRIGREPWVAPIHGAPDTVP